MKWLYFCLLYFCQMEWVWAQEQSSFTIRGVVMDGQIRQPLAYATVAVVKFTEIENILKGVVTDKDGKFELKVAKGEYKLIVRNLGYRNYVYELLPGMPDRIELGTISLKVQPEQLGVVTVKPLVEIAADEIRYDLSADPDRETASLHSILDKVPMIRRSPMGDLYVDEPGKKFLVVRNGKTDALFSGNLDDILQALPAKGFAAISVLLAPPERYGDYDYVVNIETDRNTRLYGMVGNLQEDVALGTGTFDSKAAVVSSLNKLRFSLEGLFRNMNMPVVKQLIEKQVVGELRRFRQEQRNEVSEESWGAGSFGSCDLSDQHFFNWRLGWQEGNDRDKNRLKSGYEEMSVTDFVKQKNSQTWQGGIDYQYDIGVTKQVLNVAYAFKFLPVERLDRGDEFLQKVCRQTEEEQQEQIVQLHYYRPFNRYWKLETGGGYLYRYYFSEETERRGESEDHVVPGSRSRMESHKHIVNAYLRLDYSRKRFSAGIELKADYLNDGQGTELVLPDRSENISETGLNLMPKIRAGWLFPKSKFSRLSLEYQLRHSRPPFRMLSTYEDISNGDYIQIGNPDLRLQKEHVLRISTWMGGLGINAVWNYSDDRIGEYWYLDGKNRTIRTYGNYGYMSGYSLSSNYSYRRKDLMLSLMAGGSYTHGEAVRRERLGGWSVKSSCACSYMFSNHINTGLTLGYNNRFESGFSRLQLPVWSLAIWGKIKLLKDRMDLEVYYSDLTRFTRNTEHRIVTADFMMNQQMNQSYIPLTVKLNWRLGSFKLKPVKNIRKSVVMDDVLEE